MTPFSPKKLFLLDAMALIYRAYFAFSKNPRYNSKGMNTSAVLGFTNTLFEVLSKEKPTHIAVAFDTEAPTSRHTEFADYKAHRDAIPEDLLISIPYIKRLIEGFNIPVILSDGYEADDIIGTLAKRAEKEGFVTYMMTPDKDFGQLVSENIFIYKPARMGNGVEIMGVQEVLAKFEIKNVDQVRDLLGLWGDASDNIPGIPGVGEKTAKLLISQYGSIEGIIENSSQIQGKLREKVEQHKDQAILSKKLATIICDVPLDIEIDALTLGAPNKEVLKELFAEMEFRALSKRILGENEPVPIEELSYADSSGAPDLFSQPALPTSTPSLFDELPEEHNFKTIKTVDHQYYLVDTEEKRAALANTLNASTTFCFDTETTGIDANNVDLVGLAFSVKPYEAYYVPVPENRDEVKLILETFKTALENEQIEKSGQNLKYDIIVLKCYGIQVRGKLFDTMLAHYLIEPDMRHNLTIMSETLLNYTPVPIESLIGQKKNGQLSMRTVPIDQITDYAGEDADIALQLKDVLAPMLNERSVKKLYDEVEEPLIWTLADMEMEGIKIDIQALQDFSLELETDVKVLEQNIYSCCGQQFNIASPKQLGDILFDVLQIDEKAKRTKTKQYATGEEVLAKLVDKHPIVPMILDYRQLQKLKNTYVDTLPSMINPRTGRVHTSFNQTVAATGRLSSNNPNLQNIPIRSEKGKEVRKAFIPRDENHTLLSADYSQIELRIIAEISGDETMQEAFKNKIDIHTATASKVFGVSLEDVTTEMRRKSKMVNFGIIYGISAFGLAQRLSIPRKEAAMIIEQYLHEYQGVKKYMDSSINIARERGYVETILGRRRYLKDINSQNAMVRGFAERNAINAPIQGSAADLIKIAMNKIHRALKQENLKSKMVLQVHDELVFDVVLDEVEQMKELVKTHMQNAISTNVPLEVELGTGHNWLAAH